MRVRHMSLMLAVLSLGGCAVLGKRVRTVEPSSITIGEETYSLWRPVGADSVVVDGVTYRVESRFVTDSVLWIQSRVVAANRTGEAARVIYGRCSPLIRLYLDSTRVGLPIWDESRAITDKAGCSRRGGRAYRFEPGEERQLHAVAVAPRRLRAFLPPRRYFFSVVFWLGDEAFEVASGQEELEG